MEMRRQVVPSPVATLKIYEGALTKAQRDNLESILSDVGLKELPNSEFPQIPGTSRALSGFRVEIKRADAIQRVAFADWAGPSKPREGASAEEIERQERIHVLLEPLIGWFHDLQGQNMKPSDAEPNLCGLH